MAKKTEERYRVEVIMNSTSGSAEVQQKVREFLTSAKPEEAGNLKTCILLPDEKKGEVNTFFCLDEAKKEDRYGMVRNLFTMDKEGNEVTDETGKPVPLDKNSVSYILQQKATFIPDTGAMRGPLLRGTIVVTPEEKKSKTVHGVSDEMKEALRMKIRERVIGATPKLWKKEKEEIAERLRIMAENNIDHDLQLSVIRGWKRYKKPGHRPSCIWVDPYLKGSKPGHIEKGLRRAVARMPLICQGEKSVGKNVYCETIAYLMMMPMYLITFNQQMDPQSVYGEQTTDNSSKTELAALKKAKLSEEYTSLEEREKAFSGLAKTYLACDGELYEEMLKIASRGSKKCLAIMQTAKQKCYRQWMGLALSDQQKTALLPLIGVDADIHQAFMQTLDMAERELFKLSSVEDILAAQSASINLVMSESELCDWLVDGGLMIFNEMNMADANFFSSFANQLTDGTGFLFVPGRGEIPIHNDCVLFGTQNEDYAGCNEQNEATKSRFGCLSFEQPGDITKQLQNSVRSALKKRGIEMTLSLDHFVQTNRFYVQMKDAVAKEVLSTNDVLNIRGCVRALTLVGMSNGASSLVENLEIEVVNNCDADDRPAIKKQLKAIVTL